MLFLIIAGHLFPSLGVNSWIVLAAASRSTKEHEATNETNFEQTADPRITRNLPLLGCLRRPLGWTFLGGSLCSRPRFVSSYCLLDLL